MGGNVSLIDGHIDNVDRCVCCGKIIPEGRQVCFICGKEKAKKQTNYDRIRNMSVEELAGFLRAATEDLENCRYCPANKFCDENYAKFADGCYGILKAWLESEVNNNG